MHFFSPVPVMKIVEIISGLQTSEQTLNTTLDLAKAMGKVGRWPFAAFLSAPFLLPSSLLLLLLFSFLFFSFIYLHPKCFFWRPIDADQRLCPFHLARLQITTNSKDLPGFIANRILMPYINEACMVLQEGTFIDAWACLVDSFELILHQWSCCVCLCLGFDTHESCLSSNKPAVCILLTPVSEPIQSSPPPACLCDQYILHSYLILISFLLIHHRHCHSWTHRRDHEAGHQRADGSSAARRFHRPRHLPLHHERKIGFSCLIDSAWCPVYGVLTCGFYLCFWLWRAL